jgi:adenylylsulfate kinase
VSALTAHQSARDYIEDKLPNLQIGYVKCSIETCSARDPKGLYAKAKNGEIATLIGYNTKYIPPTNPDIVLDTEIFGVEENTLKLLKYLENFTD